MSENATSVLDTLKSSAEERHEGAGSTKREFGDECEKQDEFVKVITYDLN